MAERDDVLKTIREKAGDSKITENGMVTFAVAQQVIDAHKPQGAPEIILRRPEGKSDEYSVSTLLNMLAT